MGALRGKGRTEGLAALVLLGLAGSCACAAENEEYQLDIPVSEAKDGLGRLARQTGTPLLYLSSDVGDRKVASVKGSYTLNEALEIMLQGTGISAVVNRSGVLTVSVVETVGEANEDDKGVSMNRGSILSRLVALLAGTSAALGSSVVMAQESAAAPGGIEEISVTGSRIERPGMTSPVPVTALSNNELNNISPGNLSQALQEIPQFLNNTVAQNRSNFHGAAGQAFLNIRGMGAQRTLVLLNGRRVAPSDRQSNVDVNLFPDAMISRVDVVSGGASAAYGADALAGVANFIVDTRYTGFKASIQGGQTSYQDGDNWEAMVPAGLPVGDRLHVIASLEAYGNDDIRGKVAGLDDRSWFENWGWVTNPAWKAGDPPGTNPRRLTVPQAHSSAFTPGGKINQPGFSYNGHTFIGDGTQTRVFVPGSIYDTTATTGGPEYGIARLGQRQNLQAEVERMNLFLNADYQLTDRTELNFQAIAGENAAYSHKINGGLGASMMGIYSGTIYVDNAFLPEHIRQAMINEGLKSFRMEKGGMVYGRNNIQDDLTDGTEISQNMVLVGVNHDLSNGWGLNAYYQRGKSHKHMSLDNLLRVDRWFLAQDAVRDPATGNIVCNVQLYNPTPAQLAESVRDVLVPSPQGPVVIASPIGLDNTIAGCVPLNIFGWGNASQEARDYVVTDKWAESYITQDFAEAVLTGELFENRRLGSIGFSLGATYRKEDLYQAAYPRDIDDLGPPVNRPDLGIRGIPNGFELGTPDLHQFSTLTTFGGNFNVWETFAEVLVPLYDNGTQRLDWNVAARYADYSLSGGVVAWKTGLDFQATDELRVRATLSRDVREATFAERFDQQAGGATINDPVLDGRAFSTNILSGGNPVVAPEEADTYVIGFVYEPAWLSGSALSLDYYDIDLTGAIGRLGVQRIVDDCFAGDAAMCARIERHPSTNEITLVSDIYTNIDGAKTRGVDIEVSYRMEPDFVSNISENLSIRMLAGYLAERSETPLGGITTEFAGSGVSPEWSTTTTLNYSLGAWDLSLTHRFIDSVKREVNWVEGVDVDINKVEAVRWMNMRLAYTHESDRGNWEAFGSIVNLFDAHPPMYASNISRGLPGNFSSMHHTLALGRNYVVGLRYEF